MALGLGVSYGVDYMALWSPQPVKNSVEGKINGGCCIADLKKKAD